MWTEGCGLIVMNISRCLYFQLNLNNSALSVQPISFERLVEFHVIGLICLIGIFGNILTVFVLRREKERQNALLLLQALAVADGLYLIVALLRYPLKYILPVYRDYIVMQPVVFPMLKTCQTLTIWTMVLVTIDRYIYLCKPLHAPRLFDKRLKQGTAVAVFILGLLYNLPRFFGSCIVDWFNPCTNTTITRSVTRQQFNHPLYYDIYQQGAYIVLLYIVPLLILASLNTCLVRTIVQSKRFNRENTTTSSDHTDNNATLVLVIIVLVFIVCQTPELFVRLSTVIERKVKSVEFTRAFSKGLNKLNTISQLLMVVNSSINFFIYVTFGASFRGLLKETFTTTYPKSVTLTTHESIPLQRNQSNHVRADTFRGN